MKRRAFVKSSLLLSAIPTILPESSGAAITKKNKQEFYELRVYTLKNETQEKLIENYFQTAAIPALNRLGSQHVGVFKELKPEGQTKIYVLIPFASVEDYLKVYDKLAKDEKYQQAAAAYLNAPAKEPAYERIQSSLLKAFTHMPKLEVPENKPRIFELRRYESASEAAGKKKIEMFNEKGEIDIFKRVGLTPVFFGETLIGEMRPNLTYMLTFDDMAEHDRNWKAFGADAQWQQIRSIPEYADSKIVSRITRTFLVPSVVSQI
ncbi:MAG: NIPSNAP family protein [Flavisolibacter sp.]|nr:NIPSNAP family protein [Flavisolibacter sp.]